VARDDRSTDDRVHRGGDRSASGHGYPGTGGGPACARVLCTGAQALLVGLLLTGCENPLANPNFLIGNNSPHDLVVLTVNESGGIGRTPVASDDGNEIATQGRCSPVDIVIEFTDGRTLATLDDKQVCPGGILTVEADYTIALDENA
jgi:hypothetical protein